MKLTRTAVHATHSWVNMTGRWLMPKPFWLGVPLCVVLVSTQACTYSTSWQRSNETGVEAYQQGHYAEAEKYYLAALKEAETFGPEDPRLQVPPDLQTPACLLVERDDELLALLLSLCKNPATRDGDRRIPFAQTVGFP